MPRSPQRSLRHEYELYVENEIEAYKESLSRSALLKLGDEAVAALRAQPQLALTELVVWEEVDRIIARRLRLVSYTTWRRRRLKDMRERQRPEHWGLTPDCALAREVHPTADAAVLVAGEGAERPACYLAAQGCEVVAIDRVEDAVQRVVDAAYNAGLASHVHGYVADLREWSVETALYAAQRYLSAVVCTPTAFAGMTVDEWRRAIAVLQSVTRDGGVHLLDAGGDDAPSIGELSAQYRGWRITVSDGAVLSSGASSSFVARKGAA